MFCTRCGKEIDESARFCRMCGAPTDAKDNGGCSAGQAVQSEPKKDHSLRNLIIVIVIVAVIVVSALGYRIYKSVQILKSGSYYDYYEYDPYGHPFDGYGDRPDDSQWGWDWDEGYSAGNGNGNYSEI